MERHHVAKCVITEIAQKNSKIEIKKEDVDAILHELEFYPKNYFLYSATGCKTISAKVDYFMEQFEDLDESVWKPFAYLQKVLVTNAQWARKFKNYRQKKTREIK